MNRSIVPILACIIYVIRVIRGAVSNMLHEGVEISLDYHKIWINKATMIEMVMLITFLHGKKCASLSAPRAHDLTIALRAIGLIFFANIYSISLFLVI